MFLLIANSIKPPEVVLVVCIVVIRICAITTTIAVGESYVGRPSLLENRKYKCCFQCPSSLWQQQIYIYKKESRWLKIEKEPTWNGNVSKFAPRPFECQMCGARRQSVRTLLCSSQLIFQRRAAAERTFSLVTLYGRWGYSMIRSTIQHCLLSVTVQSTEWFWSECFV